jgi:hypothetical protein
MGPAGDLDEKIQQDNAEDDEGEVVQAISGKKGKVGYGQGEYKESRQPNDQVPA